MAVTGQQRRQYAAFCICINYASRSFFSLLTVTPFFQSALFFPVCPFSRSFYNDYNIFTDSDAIIYIFELVAGACIRFSIY